MRITGISITGTVNPSYRDYKVGSPEVRQRGEYVVPEGVVQARAGGTLPVRLQLVPLGGGAARTLEIALPVPVEAAGGFGQLSVRAGNDPFVNTEDAPSFAEILEAVRAAPTPGTASVALQVEGEGGGLTWSAVTPADRVLPFFADLPVQVNRRS